MQRPLGFSHLVAIAKLVDWGRSPGDDLVR
jgi:hypothetical protein